jgi:hypothetical protein
MTPGMPSEDWIEQAEFPATKLELIELAESGGAPQEQIERLQRLSQEQYENAGEVQAELDGLA